MSGALDFSATDQASNFMNPILSVGSSGGNIQFGVSSKAVKWVAIAAITVAGLYFMAQARRGR